MRVTLFGHGLEVFIHIERECMKQIIINTRCENCIRFGDRRTDKRCPECCLTAVSDILSLYPYGATSAQIASLVFSDEEIIKHTLNKLVSDKRAEYRHPLYFPHVVQSGN